MESQNFPSVNDTADQPDGFAQAPTSATMVNYDAAGATIHVYNQSNVVHTHEKKECSQEDFVLKKSINNIPRPTQDFYETAKYKEILQFVKNEQTLILQCYGVPGSGKTEIVKRLAECFPYESNNESQTCIKLYIQCKGKTDMYEELEEFLLQMKKDNLLMTGSFQNILYNLKKHVANSFVSALYNLCSPVLLVIEDIPPKQLWMRDFLRNLVKRNCLEESQKVHVYFTTRQKSAVLQSEEERRKMSHYRLQRISGFNQEESIKFLINEDIQNFTEMEYSKRLFERFSGSPLGLRVAKGYCRKAKITYQDYLEWIEEASEDDIHQEKEEELIKEEYGETWQHVFQAIVMPFVAIYRESKDAQLIWNVLACLSYLNQSNIPRFLLNKAFQILREEPVKNLKRHSTRDSGFLMSDFSDYDMCTIDSSNELISFHEVVLHAFRICQPKEFIRIHQDCAKFFQIKNAVMVMAGLITKDLRSKENKERMDKLFPHLRVVLEHVNDDEFIIPDNYHKKDLLNLVISHLYETAGAIAISTSEYSRLCEVYFQQAIKHVCWSKINCFSDPFPDKNSTEKISKQLVEECARNGNNLPEGFITEYESAVFFLCDEAEEKFLESQSRDKEKFLQVKNALKAEEKSRDVIKLLRECGVFLQEDLHGKFFFAERIASILHSWSRVILYTEESNNESAKALALWRSSVSQAISVECRKLFNVTLLCEKLSFTTGKIPIILRIKSDETALREAQSFCETSLHKKDSCDKNSETYEHGMLKDTYGPSHPKQKMQMYRNLIRIHTRLLKSTTEPQSRESLIQKGNTYAKKLFELATDHVHKLSNAPTWIVRCGKYFAASGNDEEAMKCFDVYFAKAKKDSMISFDDHSWASFNYARAIVSLKKSDRKDDATAKVKDTLKQTNEWLRSSLKQKLKDILKELGSL